MFIKGPTPTANDLEDAFRREVFALLKKEGKLNTFVIENMMNWHHGGFNVYCGKTLWPDKEEGLENLARYIIRADNLHPGLLFKIRNGQGQLSVQKRHIIQNM